MKPFSPYPKIFVVGCPRSGTSWTSEMIGQHDSIVKLPGETHLYKLVYDPFTYLPQMGWQKRIQRRAWIYKHYGLSPIITGFNSRNLWSSLPRIYRFYRWSGCNSGPHTCIGYEEFCYLARVAATRDDDDLGRVTTLIESVLDSAFYNNGGAAGKTLLEKTPMHLKYADVILRSFPEAKVIEVVRDIRGVCASWQARSVNQKWARKPTASLVDQWKRGVELTEKFKHDETISDRILQVRYEDLKQNTTAGLQTIFKFLNLPITEPNIQQIAAKSDIRNVKDKGEGLHVRKGMIDSWKEELSATDIETCHQLAGPLLEKLGYALTSSSASA